MPDRNQTPEQELERDLRELGARIKHPPTPDIAQSVRSRIDEEAAPPNRRSRTSLPISPRWAAAAAVLILVLAIPVFSFAVRDTLSSVFTAGAGGSAQSSSGSVSSDQGMDQDMDEGMAGSSATPESAGDGEALEPSGGGQEPLPSGGFDRKVIKTADLGIRSEDVRRSATKAQRIVVDSGGSVQSSQVDQGDGPVSAELVLSVTSQEFDATLEELRGLGKNVTADAVSGKDVTEEFVDLKSRERNLLASEQNLLDLYNEADDVNDSLSIQRELTDVRGRIEQVQGRIKYLEQRTDFSRIELTIQPVRDEASPETGWSPGDVAGQAWNASLGVLQTLATTVISIAVFSWWLVPLPIAGLVWWRRSRTSNTDSPDSP